MELGTAPSLILMAIIKPSCLSSSRTTNTVLFNLSSREPTISSSKISTIKLPTLLLLVVVALRSSEMLLIKLLLPSLLAPIKPLRTLLASLIIWLNLTALVPMFNINFALMRSLDSSSLVPSPSSLVPLTISSTLNAPSISTSLPMLPP